MTIQLLKQLDAFLITNPTNIRYLTGFVGVAEHEREAYVLLALNKLYLFTGPLYLESARNAKCPTRLPASSNRGEPDEQVPNIKLEIIQISGEKTISKRLKEVLDTIPHSRNTTVGFEEDDLKVSEFNEILKQVQNDRLRITLVPIKNKIEKLRMIKREDEIENIREAARLTDKCFEYIVGKLKPSSRRGGSASRGGPSLTESQIAWEIESFIRKSGAELSFSPIVAFGKNTSQPHYNTFSFARPGLAKLNLNSLSERPQSNQGLALKSNDIILLDFGARVNGYCSDMTRVIFVGKPKPEWIRAYETVLRAQESAISYLRAQACLPASPNRGEPIRQSPPLGTKLSGGKADRIARTIIKEAGFPVYPHSLGHGVGLDIHEAPRLTIKKDAPLKTGMVVTVEPGIYIEGQYGIRIEDLLLIKENDIEILSLSPKSLIIL